MEVAAGHIDKFEFIEGGGLKIVKTVKIQELQFYEEINQEEQDEDVQNLRKMLPIYYGVYKLEPVPQIILQNLLWGFKNPSILDVKMGYVTFTPDASEKKRNSHGLKMKRTTSHSLGLRIAGMVIHDVEGNKKAKWNRGGENGMYTISQENIQESIIFILGFTEFLTVGVTPSKAAAS